MVKTCIALRISWIPLINTKKKIFLGLALKFLLNSLMGNIITLCDITPFNVCVYFKLCYLK